MGATDGTRRGGVEGRKVPRKVFLERCEVITRGKELPLLRDFRSPYSVEEILQAVLAYSLTGNSAQAQRITGVDQCTIRGWKKHQPWWDEALDYVRRVKQDELDAKFTRIIHKVAEQLENKLNNGEDLTAGELSRVASVIFDKRNLLRGDPTNINQKDSNIDGKMAELRDRFEQMSRDIRDRLPPSQVIN